MATGTHNHTPGHVFCAVFGGLKGEVRQGGGKVRRVLPRAASHLQQQASPCGAAGAAAAASTAKVLLQYSQDGILVPAGGQRVGRSC
jgi:hypothetical protein